MCTYRSKYEENKGPTSGLEPPTRSLRGSLFTTHTAPGMTVLQVFAFLQCSSSNRPYRQISPLLLTFVDVPFQSLIGRLSTNPEYSGLQEIWQGCLGAEVSCIRVVFGALLGFAGLFVSVKVRRVERHSRLTYRKSPKSPEREGTPSLSTVMYWVARRS